MNKKEFVFTCKGVRPQACVVPLTYHTPRRVVCYWVIKMLSANPNAVYLDMNVSASCGYGSSMHTRHSLEGGLSRDFSFDRLEGGRAIPGPRVCTLPRQVRAAADPEPRNGPVHLPMQHSGEDVCGLSAVCMRARIALEQHEPAQAVYFRPLFKKNCSAQPLKRLVNPLYYSKLVNLFFQPHHRIPMDACVLHVRASACVLLLAFVTQV